MLQLFTESRNIKSNSLCRGWKTWADSPILFICAASCWEQIFYSWKCWTWPVCQYCGLKKCLYIFRELFVRGKKTYSGVSLGEGTMVDSSAEAEAAFVYTSTGTLIFSGHIKAGFNGLTDIVRILFLYFHLTWTTGFGKLAFNECTFPPIFIFLEENIRLWRVNGFRWTFFFFCTEQPLAKTAAKELELRVCACVRVCVCVCVCVCAWACRWHWLDFFLLSGYSLDRQTARPQQHKLTALICFDRGSISTALSGHLLHRAEASPVISKLWRKALVDFL